MDSARLQQIVDSYAAKPGWHGNVFVRFVIRDGTVKVEHWSVELAGTKGNISRRVNGGAK